MDLEHIEGLAMPFLGDNGRAGVRAYKPRGAAMAILLWAWVAAQGVVARAEEDAFLARADVVPPVTSLELPAYAHMCDASGTEYVLVVATESQLRRQGWRYSMIEPATAPEEYLVAHPVRPGARAAAKGRFRIVYDDGRQWVVRATANDADALADLGFELLRLPAVPIVWTRPGVGVAQKMGAMALAGAAGYDVRVAAMINSVGTGRLMSRLKRFTGDEPAIAAGDLYTIQTRHTSSGTPIAKATQAVYDHFEALGLAPSFHAWPSGRNVIGTQWGTIRSNEIVIVVAHLDDMPSSGVAPGADDNGSGSAAVLLSAELLRPYRFDRTLRYVLVTGEEQGLLGSYYYAQAARAAGDNIVAVYNMDMIAWDGTHPPEFQLHTRSFDPGKTLDRAIADVFTNVVAQYGLSNSLTPVIQADGIQYSDHKRFWDAGYPAVCAIEAYGTSDFNPYYHGTGDTVAHMNQTYFTATTKASIGTTAHLAEPVAPSAFSLVEVAISDWTPGSGIGVSVLFAGHAEGATAGGADGHDLAWSNAPANPNPKWLKIATTPYGTDLRKDVRPSAPKSVFHATLSAVDTAGGGVSCSNRLRFAFLPAPESTCVYTATIRVDGQYTIDSRGFVCVTNLVSVVGDSGYGYVALPMIVGVPDGVAFGTLDLILSRARGTVMSLR
jgi:hypothetical protein